MSVILLVVLTNFILTFLFCFVSVALSHSIRHLLWHFLFDCVVYCRLCYFYSLSCCCRTKISLVRPIYKSKIKHLKNQKYFSFNTDMNMKLKIIATAGKKKHFCELWQMFIVFTFPFLRLNKVKLEPL